MKRIVSSSVIPLLGCLLAFAVPRDAAAQDPSTCYFDPIPQAGPQFPAPPSAVTHVASQSGAWQNASTWCPASVPGKDDVVYIPDNVDVSINHQIAESDPLKFVQVDGLLRMVISVNTRLATETLYINQSGVLAVGLADLNYRVHADKTAEFVFTGSGDIDLAWDPKQHSRGLISEGSVYVFGAKRTPWSTMRADVLADDQTQTLHLDYAPVGWRPGDQIVLSGTYFKRGDDTREEVREIQSISGNQVTVTAPFSKDHVRPRGTHRLHVGNLTRNLIFRSKTADPPATEIPIKERGHVMFMNKNVEIRHALFKDLGRTDKTIPLDDLIVDSDGGVCPPINPNTNLPDSSLDGPWTGIVTEPDPSTVQNRRGRYAVHFHKNGIQVNASQPPSRVLHSVVWGTPGWGFVNHSSHVDFQYNLAYDFDGAGFVTESGDELGNFFNNLAIGGRGNGEYRDIRIVFENCDRPQPLSDFGFLGEGFWFQGPAIRVRDNVANSCHGTGMVFFTTGAPNPDDIGGDNRINYVGLADSAVSAVYGSHPEYGTFAPRHWNHSPDPKDLLTVIADLPILEMDGYVGYANFQGLHLRFSNMKSDAWYSEDVFNFHTDILEGFLTPVDRMGQGVKDLTLWNNEFGIRGRYISDTDFANAEIVNRLRYGGSTLNSGCEVSFEVYDGTTMTNIEVDGYPMACWLERGPTGGTNHPFPNGIGSQGTYSHYAMAEEWHFPLDSPQNNFCPDVTQMQLTSSGSNSLELTPVFQTGSATESPVRMLIRYWPTSEGANRRVEYWDGAAGQSSYTITGLEPNTSYSFQAMVGCSTRAQTFWSATGSASTDP